MATPLPRRGNSVEIGARLRYARQCTLGLVVGRRLVIRPKRDADGEDADKALDAHRREAVIVRVRREMRYDVRYLDDVTIERDVTRWVGTKAGSR